MAQFVLARSVTIPAGTAIASPVSADISFPEYEVEAVQIVIPPGPNGNVGFRLANANTQIIPYGSNDWIIGNDEAPVWALQRQITSGSWQVFGYNTGIYNHTLYFRFFVNPVVVSQGDVTGAPADLSGLAGASAGGSESILAAAPPTLVVQPILANPPPAGGFVGTPPPPPIGG